LQSWRELRLAGSQLKSGELRRESYGSQAHTRSRTPARAAARRLTRAARRRSRDWR
jgi:hypothetical protein